VFIEEIFYSFVFTGWRPSEFKSSRVDRAEKRSYEPEDFMDKGERITNILPWQNKTLTFFNLSIGFW